MKNNPIICAIDTKDVQVAIKLCNEIKPYVGMVKLGLEFFTMNGPDGIKAIQSCGIPIFLDLKFFDIPNTVAECVRSAVRLGVNMLTIHASGGTAMMSAALQAANDETMRLGTTAPLILGVTVLTSMDASDIADIGISRDVSTQVLSLAKLSKDSGLSGIVCSPLEIELIKKECPGLKLIVPGIRPASASKDDQKRIMTPHQAIKSGADYIVIGRPITKAENPVEAAKAIAKEVENA